MKDTKEIAKDYTERNDIPLGRTYNERGQELTYRDSTGYWYERTYNDKGKVLTFKEGRTK